MKKLDPNNVEDIFRSGFENFEAEVNPDVWTNIQKSLNNPSANGQGRKEDVGQSSNITRWTIAAAIALLAGLGIWYFAPEKPEEPVADIKKDIVAVQPEEKEVATPENITVKEDKEVAKTPPVPAVKEKITVPSKAVNAISEPSKKEEAREEKHLMHEFPAKQPALDLVSLNENKKEMPIVPWATTGGAEKKDEKKSDAGEDYKRKPFNWDEANEQLIAKIEATPVEGPSPLTVSFVNLYGAAKTYVWNFGDGSPLDSSGSKLTHTYSETGEYTVTLTVRSESGKSLSTSEKITVSKKSRIDVSKIPTVFTPNNDGAGDRFCIQGESLKSINVAIMNVNEQMLFNWNRLDDCWDGKDYAGEPLPEGKYYWIANAIGADGKKILQKGEINIKR